MDIQLLENLALLLALSVFYGFVADRWQGRNLTSLVFSGFVFGAFTLAVMFLPFRYQPGIFFDSRSVVLAMAGLFGGPIPAAIAAAMASVYRLIYGGPGTLTGIGVISTSASLGVLFYYLRRRDANIVTPWKLVIFGAIVHVAMLLWMFSLPGETAWRALRVIAVPVLVFFPLVTALLGTVMMDLERRGRTRQSLRYSTRALKTLSQCNRAVARAVETRSFVTEVASILARFAGYRLVCISLRANDGEGALRIEAWAGAEADKVAGLTFDWNDPALCEGPVRAALSGGNAVIRQDLLHDPESRAWWPVARRLGFVSSIALPLRGGHGAVGVLSVYSWDRREFGTKEQSLLNELADDIAFGLESLRVRREVDRAHRQLAAGDERYRLLFETMVQGVVFQDSQGNVTSANAAAERILGLTHDEIVGRASADSRWRIIRMDGSELPSEEHPAMIALRTGSPVPDAVLGVFNPREENHRWIITSSKPFFRPGEEEPYQVQTIFEDITARRRTEKSMSAAQDKLQEQDKIYQLITKNMKDVVWLMSMNLDILYMSPSIERILGFTAEEIKSLPLDKQLTPESFERFMAMIARTLTPENLADKDLDITTSIEVEHYRKDGTTVWSESSAAVVRDEQGSPTGIVGSSHDISERKQAETRLRQSEQTYRLLADNTLDCIWTMDINLNFIYVNPAIEPMTGYTPAEWMDSNLADHADAENLAIMAGVVGEALSKPPAESGIIFEAEIKKKSGESIPVEIVGKVIYGPDGNPIGLQGTTRDISERRAADAELKRQYEMFELIINHIPVMIVIYNPNFNVTLLNEACEKAIGWLTKDAKEIDLMERCFPDPEIRQKIHEFVDAAPPEWMDLDLTARDGRVLKSTWTTIVLSDDTRVAIGLDITDQKRAEAQRTALEEQLRQSQKMEAVGRLAGGIAHDFNNVLTAIQGFSDLVLDALGADHEAREDVRQIIEASESAARLTQQLLAFSRKQIIDPKPLDLNGVLANSEQIIRRLIGEDIDLAFYPEQDLWRIHFDAGQIEQILMNLAVNARDAMPQGGKLTFETHNVPIEDVPTAVRTKLVTGDYVMLGVSDNGHGIDAETQTKIFDPFFTTKEKGRGTGLGLATVYGIVKQNNGYVSVYSEVGHGTSFKIYLPRIGADVVEVGATTVISDLEGSEVILLVEDQENVRNVAERTLTSFGYRVLVAADGEEAVRLFDANADDIDLLLTDVILPLMGGKELLVKLNERNPDLTALYMSGYTENAIAHHGVLDKGTHFLQKPFRPRELVIKVREVLDLIER
ncbi:MAG: PAS domain S-box protein [Candidatus Lernaella stagnicola]|nr:PAS domain S-box protein [Candidatus Lernaella stagnicola]